MEEIASLEFEKLGGRLLEKLDSKIHNKNRFAKALSKDAGIEFSWQTDITAIQLVSPLVAHLFPTAVTFPKSETLLKFYEIVGFLAFCNMNSSRKLKAHALPVYCSASALVGICREQLPDSSEFSVSGLCLLLLRSADNFNIESETIARFFRELSIVATQYQDRFWNGNWVCAACHAACYVASSDERIRSTQRSNLEKIVCNDSWSENYALNQSNADEMLAMSTLLEKCELK